MIANAAAHEDADKRHAMGQLMTLLNGTLEALEKVLRGFKLQAPEEPTSPRGVRESDLCRLASESGQGCELFFFPKLRDELREQLRHEPRLVRFRGLRGCVKQLAGARRWNSNCRSLEEQIVAYLRECLSAEARRGELALVVDCDCSVAIALIKCSGPPA